MNHPVLRVGYGEGARAAAADFGQRRLDRPSSNHPQGEKPKQRHDDVPDWLFKAKFRCGIHSRAPWMMIDEAYIFHFISTMDLLNDTVSSRGGSVLNFELFHTSGGRDRATPSIFTERGELKLDFSATAARRESANRLVTKTLYGSRENFQAVGDIVRIRVFDHFLRESANEGTIRIRSASTGYDSGDQKLSGGGTWGFFFDWETRGLTPASDYQIFVDLNYGLAKTAGGANSKQVEGSDPNPLPDVTVTLSGKIFEQGFVAASVDASYPAPGIPLEFKRVVPNDHSAFPYFGPLGSGWHHNYDVSVQEYTTGETVFHGPNGINRFFKSNNEPTTIVTYNSSPGDYGALTFDKSDFTFQLKEKDGFIYRIKLLPEFHGFKFDSMQDPNGNRITAIYDGAYRLAELRHTCGKSLYLEYYPPITFEDYVNGKAYPAEYSLIHRLIDPAGRITTYEYSEGYGWPFNSLLKKVINPGGGETEYDYTTPDFLLNIQHVVASDSKITAMCNRLLRIKYPDGTFTHYEFDTDARLARRTGTWGASPIKYNYLADGTTQITDSVDAQTTIRVNDAGQPVFIEDPNGSQFRMEYDLDGNLVKSTDPLNHVTRMEYDTTGNVTGITDPLSHTVECGYNLRFNKLAWIADPLGITTSFAYDANGRMTAVTHMDGSKESYTYDGPGNLTSFKDGESNVTRYAYNTMALLTHTTNSLGNATLFNYDPSGDLKSVTDAKTHVVWFNRDILGRMTRRTYPYGAHEDYEYDASKVTAFTNRRGERIGFPYNVPGRLERKTYPSGREFWYQYDARGLLDRVFSINNLTTSTDSKYRYDLARRIVFAKYLGKNFKETYDLSYAYDAVGNRKLMVYPDGYRINYEYDAANRLKQISDATSKTIVAYEYDDAGHRTRRTLGNGTWANYTYDDQKLVQIYNYSPGGAIQSKFVYAYNRAGIRTSMISQEGTHAYGYDKLHQLTQVKYPDPKTVSYAYDPVGNRTSVNDNGAVTNYVTNALDQYTGAGSETFNYDLNGNLSSSVKAGSTTSYGWDEEDRLIRVTRNGVQIDYLYDEQGRMTAKTIGGQETRYIWDGLDLVAEIGAVSG